jgi:hypothetical protein
MKKLSIGLVAVVFALTCAFATKSSVNLKANVKWFKTDASGNLLTTPSPFVADETTASPFGCPDEGTIPCAKGYALSDINSQTGLPNNPDNPQIEIDRAQ